MICGFLSQKKYTQFSRKQKVLGYGFCVLIRVMEKNTLTGNERQKKFQISIGEEIAYVEIVSLKDRIYSVEFARQEPLFITQITDMNNKPCWVSIPHGNNALAEMIGLYIEKEMNNGQVT